MNPILEKLFAENAQNGTAVVPWENFVECALYDETFGYYRAARRRVGGEGADFYTSESLPQKVFAELVESAAESLAKSAGFAKLPFVEIGAEPDSRLLENSAVFRLGDKLSVPPLAVVFANELPDACPFARFKFSEGKWRKGFLLIEKTRGEFLRREIFGDAPDRELAFLEKYFPRAKMEGFRIDVSFDALEMFDALCSLNWRGVLIFADYFRSAAELSELACGTARAYRGHADFSDISADAGQSDITHSPCSDAFADILRSRGFSDVKTLTQESFFVECATDKVREIMTSADSFDLRKRELAQLISPVHMGASFRVLCGVRS